MVMWPHECGVVWPKCQIHFKFLPARKLQSRNRSKAALLRKFGTDKPLPITRTRPGEVQLSEEAAFKCTKFVGVASNPQSEQSPQTCDMLPKRPACASDGVELSNQDFEVSSSSHKRQPDTEMDALLEFEPKRARVNLPVGSKLARRFPQHVQCNTVYNGPDVNAVSNKRRRRLPFKTEGSQVGQSTDASII